MNQKKIGKFIQEMRKEKDLTQVELAEKLGVSNRTISKWENGGSSPDYSMFQDLCKELDITINELLSGEKIDNEDYQKKFEENFISVVEYNNRMRNQRIRRIVSFIIFLIAIYFLHKCFLAYYFYIDDNPQLTKEAFPYNVEIKNIEVNNNGKANSKVLNNLNIYIPEGFELITDKAKFSLVSDECNLYIKNFVDEDNYGSFMTVCNSRWNIKNLDYLDIRSTTLPWLDINSLFDKYNINNTIDLVRFYEKNRDFKQNLFAKSDDIKINYIARVYTERVISASDNFYYLENDLNGYFDEYFLGDKYHNNAYLSFNDEYNEDLYGISFWNSNDDYFNHDTVIEILSSISKDNE